MSSRSLPVGPTLVLALLLGLPGVAAAQSVNPVTVSRAWARAMPPGATVGAVYFTVSNAGAADTLLRLDSPVAGHIEMHSMTMQQDMMQMRLLSSVPVPAHGRVVFEPGNMHVMLLDLPRPLREGEHFVLTLTFRHAPAVQTTVAVLGIGAQDPPAAGRDGPTH
jgi:periplasmic copper chaperone A